MQTTFVLMEEELSTHRDWILGAIQYQMPFASLEVLGSSILSQQQRCAAAMAKAQSAGTVGAMHIRVLSLTTNSKSIPSCVYSPQMPLTPMVYRMCISADVCNVLGVFPFPLAIPIIPFVHAVKW